MKKILGLDLGTNSIGWALINQDIKSVNGQFIDNKAGSIVGIGSRIIPMSQDILSKFESGQSHSQTAERTGYRGVRRLRERHLLRRERLHRVLNIIGFLPEHYSKEIDFENSFGQFIEESEPKLVYKLNIDTGKNEFIFQESFFEMLDDFAIHQPELVTKNKKIPQDWTIYYLRKKALSQKISKEELAWLLLHFNQKRGYYQLRGEEEEESTNKKVEFHSLKVTDVIDSGDKKGKDEIWYNVVLENGWIYRRTSKIPLDWVGKIKEFIVTTELEDDGSVKKNKEGSEKRSFRSPDENDWTLVKKKTEFEIEKSDKTVGSYIYDTLLLKPNQKIKGKLVRVIERKFYKEELKTILECQKKFHSELQDVKLYQTCLVELYRNNEFHCSTNAGKDFTYLFLNDIIFYQRPLKSKTSTISDCKFETRNFKDKDGSFKINPIKCIAKSNPLFQEFRLLQWMQNLKIFPKDADIDITVEFLKTSEDWSELFNWLNDRKDITQEQFLKYPPFNLKKEIQNYRWNYVDDKAYPCNKTRAVILSKLDKEKCRSFLTQENEIRIWELLYSITTIEEADKAFSDNPKRDIKKTRSSQYNLYKYLTENGFTDQEISDLKKVKLEEKDYGSYSAKAIKKLLTLMRFGKKWNENLIDINTKARIEKIINAEYDEKIRDRVREKAIRLDEINNFQNLPLWLASYIVYDRHAEAGDIKYWKTPLDIDRFLKEDFKQHSLKNPIVEQVITETLRVVKDIWITYGNSAENFFHEIHIELGREMKNPKDKRERMTRQNTENENTNLRIKSLLTEFLNDTNIENVRPYSPSQQEILKIYEDGVLASLDEKEIPEDILKISKTIQPTRSDLIKYKLWLDQKYCSPYTGQIIPLSKLFTPAYEIEHIIPQSRFFDDSFSNKVICESEINKDKDNRTAYEYIAAEGGKKIELSYSKYVTLMKLDEYESFIKKNYSGNRGKMKKLMMEDIPESFIQRQMNDSRYISKVIKNLLSNIVRETEESETTSKNLISSNGTITSVLKQDWGLNNVWNEIITPRFERLNEITNTKNFGDWTNKEGKRVFQTQVPLENQKGFNKKRIDHRHHAMDALIIACATRNHINYLNNEYAKKDKRDLRFDLRNKLRRIENIQIERVENGQKISKNISVAKEFHKPWPTFTQDAKDKLFTTIISFKQNIRVINKSVNKYEQWNKDENGTLKKKLEKQIKGDSWAIRKPMHKDTVSGLVSLRFKKQVQLSVGLDNWHMIVEKSLKNKIKELVIKGYDKKMLINYFKELDYKWKDLDISKLEIYYFDDNIVASRVKIDESFNSKKIESITDTGIRQIVNNHLNQSVYQGQTDLSGKPILPESLAFSSDGLDELNKNLLSLNNGSLHKPIYKVRTFEPKGNKFNVGNTGNKKAKYVEAAKGTNLFFAIYYDEENKKRVYETIPLNIVIERQKQGLKSIPETHEKGQKILFSLSPNDLIFIPNSEEIDNSIKYDIKNLNNEQLGRIYKIVSFTGNRLYAIPYSIAKSIIDKLEFSLLNKIEFTFDNKSIKEFCWKLEVNRLGIINKLIKE